MEAFLLARLAQTLTIENRRPVALLLAGDEAQTVRATDFEWGWMNDILHHVLGGHSEHRLTSNLRSPRRIASLVNRVWDLYEALDKRDRPGGAGYATIDDDAADEVLYSTAAPGEELNQLLTELAAREGLALIAMGDGVPGYVPDPLRDSVLTAAEVKGLDFHSVCVLDAGPLLQGIIAENQYRDPTTIDALRKRLDIDRMRVALSRPTERLIWLDVNPSPGVVIAGSRFLERGYGEVSPCSPAALLQILSEEQLDVTERIQRSLADARQLITVKPDLAWSRARHATLLLDTIDQPDKSLERTTRLGVAEVLFALAFRNTVLSDHLGRPDLYHQAATEAMLADRVGLQMIIDEIASVKRAGPDQRAGLLLTLSQLLGRYPDQVEPWIVTEVGDRAEGWAREMEFGIPLTAASAQVLLDALSSFYAGFRLADAEARKQRLRERAIGMLLKDHRFSAALMVLETMPKRDHNAEAVCYEGLGVYTRASELYRELGDMASAIRCLRSIPDFDAAYDLMREAGDHPAAESYEWLRKLNAVIAEKPEKFNRVMLGSEKKLLEKTLADALGVVRKSAAKRVATKKAAAKKAAPRKKAAPKN